MLKCVVTCYNLLVLCLLGVWVVNGIDFDVDYSHIGSIIRIMSNHFGVQIYTSFQYSETGQTGQGFQKGEG